MSALPLPADSPAEPLRFTVTDYYRLAEVGILAPDARVELLDGEICRKHRAGEPFRFTVADYYRLAEVGILAPDARVELLDGEILRMSPMGSRHARQTIWINTLFGQTFGERCLVACQVPLRLNDFSEPEPDLMILPARDDFYDDPGQPGPKDVHLLIEVSDTSLAFDREVKLPLYAASGVAEVWIVDLPEGLLRVHRRPAGREYAEIRSLGPGESVSPLAFPDVSFPVERLIGRDAAR